MADEVIPIGTDVRLTQEEWVAIRTKIEGAVRRAYANSYTGDALEEKVANRMDWFDEDVLMILFTYKPKEPTNETVTIMRHPAAVFTVFCCQLEHADRRRAIPRAKPATARKPRRGKS